MRTISAVHIHTNNTIALLYLRKMGGKTDKKLVDLSKDIRKYLLLKQIKITAEYIPGILIIRAKWQYSHSMDFQKRTLSPIVLQSIWKEIEIPMIDMFASRSLNQIAKYIS